jgi:hypothetical protein
LASANTRGDADFRGHVVVDASLHADGARMGVLFSNSAGPRGPSPIETRGAGAVRIQEPDGRLSGGPVRTVGVDLAPAEIQILRRSPA